MPATKPDGLGLRAVIAFDDDEIALGMRRADCPSRWYSGEL